MTGCRISRVRFKTGADLTILPPLNQAESAAIDILVRALELARTGAITSVAVIGFDENGLVVNNYHIPAGAGSMSLVGACERMKGRIIHDFNECD